MRHQSDTKTPSTSTVSPFREINHRLHLSTRLFRVRLGSVRWEHVNKGAMNTSVIISLITDAIAVGGKMSESRVGPEKKQ